jgi:predicted ATPase
MLTNQLGAGAADLAELVPELGQFGPDLPRSLSADAESMRFRLFDAVTTLVSEEARSQPIVLVLEDVHAADESSLLLLRFVERTVTDARLLSLRQRAAATVQRLSRSRAPWRSWREPNGSATSASAISLGRMSPTLSLRREMSPPRGTGREDLHADGRPPFLRQRNCSPGGSGSQRSNRGTALERAR